METIFKKYLDVIMANDFLVVGDIMDFDGPYYDKETNEPFNEKITGLVVGTDFSFDEESTPVFLILFIDKGGKEYYAEFVVDGKPKNKIASA